MKLRFQVDQAACFRKGIDCPKSIVTVEVDPKSLTPEERNLIADRLTGIDVCSLWNSSEGTVKNSRGGEPAHIIAEGVEYADLMVAIRANQKEVEGRKDRHRAIAVAVAEGGVDTVGMLKSFNQHKADRENAKDAAAEARKKK